MVGEEGEMKDSARIPRCCVYQERVAGMDLTVRTRWSRDVIVAARIGDAISVT